MTKVPSMKPHKPHVLTINGGSSSIKFAIFEAGGSPQRILEGAIDRIGWPEATFRVKALDQSNNFSRPVTGPDHTAAVGAVEAVGALMDWIEERDGNNALAAVGLEWYRAARSITRRSESLRKWLWSCIASARSILIICRRSFC